MTRRGGMRRTRDVAATSGVLEGYARVVAEVAYLAYGGGVSCIRRWRILHTEVVYLAYGGGYHTYVSCHTAAFVSHAS